MYDLLIRDATLASTGQRADLAVAGERIALIRPGIEGEAGQVIQASGKLLSMGFIDSHIHADKALIADRMAEQPPTASYTEFISHSRGVKRTFTVEDVRQRATRVFKQAAANGTTTLRTQIELDPIVGTMTAEGVLLAVRDCAGLVDVQTVSFGQEGWQTNEVELDCRPYVRRGLEMGLQYVGGNVNPSWPSDPQDQIDDIFRLAREYGVGVDVHIDYIDSAVGNNLPRVARRTIEGGLQGRVCAAHVAGLAYVPPQLQARAINAARQAGVTVCCLPLRIRVTPVPALIQAGVNVTIGTDNMQDMFTGLGRADMLENGLLMARVINYTWPHQLQQIFATFTTNAARALELDGRLGLEEGKQADLVLLDTDSVTGAIRDSARRLYVIKRGRVIARDGALV